MNEKEDKSAADSANSGDKDFNEEVNRRLEHGTETEEENSDDAAEAFRQQRDEDEESVLEEEDDEGTPVKPDNS